MQACLLQNPSDCVHLVADRCIAWACCSWGGKTKEENFSALIDGLGHNICTLLSAVMWTCVQNWAYCCIAPLSAAVQWSQARPVPTRPKPGLSATDPCKPVLLVQPLGAIYSSYGSYFSHVLLWQCSGLAAATPRVPSFPVALQAEARDPTVVTRTLVSGIMSTWAAGSVYPVAEIRSALGQAGTLPCCSISVYHILLHCLRKDQRRTSSIEIVHGSTCIQSANCVVCSSRTTRTCMYVSAATTTFLWLLPIQLQYLLWLVSNMCLPKAGNMACDSKLWWHCR